MFVKSDSATYALFSSFDLMNVRIAHPVGTSPERRNDFGESFDLEYYSGMRMRLRAMYPNKRATYLLVRRVVEKKVGGDHCLRRFV